MHNLNQNNQNNKSVLSNTPSRNFEHIWSFFRSKFLLWVNRYTCINVLIFWHTSCKNISKPLRLRVPLSWKLLSWTNFEAKKIALNKSKSYRLSRMCSCDQRRGIVTSAKTCPHRMHRGSRLGTVLADSGLGQFFLRFRKLCSVRPSADLWERQTSRVDFGPVTLVCGINVIKI